MFRPYPTHEQTMNVPYVPQFPQHLQVPEAAGGPIPSFPGQMVAGAPGVGADGYLPMEQSYIENILRFNRGKEATFYTTYELNPDWPARVFRGVIEEAGRDHIIISNRQAGKHYLLLMVNLDYVEFDEPISYVPLGGAIAPPAQQR